MEYTDLLGEKPGKYQVHIECWLGSGSYGIDWEPIKLRLLQHFDDTLPSYVPSDKRGIRDNSRVVEILELTFGNFSEFLSRAELWENLALSSTMTLDGIEIRTWLYITNTDISGRTEPVYSTMKRIVVGHNEATGDFVISCLPVMLKNSNSDKDPTGELRVTYSSTMKKVITVAYRNTYIGDFNRCVELLIGGCLAPAGGSIMPSKSRLLLSEIYRMSMMTTEEEIMYLSNLKEITAWQEE
jgi:hypothetical protein